MTVRLTFVLVVLVVLLGLPALASAQLDCVVPMREEGFDATRPGAEALRRTAREVAAIVQRNAVFMAGRRPIRVRTSISYYGDAMPAASVITRAYNQKAWQAGRCDVSRFADRGGGLSDGTIAIVLNEPDSLLGGPIGDAELGARLGPVVGAAFKQRAVYGAGGNAANPWALFSAAGYVPWVPVTVADLLAWQDRTLTREEQSFQAAQRDAGGGLSEAKIEEIYQNMKKVDPAAAEKARAQMLATLPKTRADAERGAARAAGAIAARRKAFEAYRASLTPVQLAGPGTLGVATSASGANRVDDPGGRPLVRMDPAFARRDPGRLHLLAVSLAPQPKTDPNAAWQEASYLALDLAALAALIGK